MPTDFESRLPSATSLLIFGASGHGRVVADAAIGQWTTLLASDRNPARCVGELLPGIACQLPDAALAPDCAVHIAIGHNGFREREVGLWQARPLVKVLHRDATVSPLAHVGAGSFVAARAVLAPMARIGCACIVNHGAVVDHDVVLGDFCHVAPGAVLGGGVRLGHRVLIGAGATVLPGLSIADEVVVGAGAVVCSDLVEAGTYVGVPAKRVK